MRHTGKKNGLYYDAKNDKAYRIINIFWDKVHFKEVKTNTGRAKMGERIQTMDFFNWCEFSEHFTETKADFIPYLKGLYRDLTNILPQIKPEHHANN